MLFGCDFNPKLLREGSEKDEDYYLRLRRLVDPDRRSGDVSRARVERVLRQLGQASRNKVSVVVALLDEELPNGYAHKSGSLLPCRYRTASSAPLSVSSTALPRAGGAGTAWRATLAAEGDVREIPH